MQLDPAHYLRLDVPHSLGATAAGAAFATSSGDVLDVSEAGAVGLLLMIWAFGRAFVSVRADPWLLAALVGPALHAFLDFGFQLPAVSALFACLAAIRPSPHAPLDG